MEQRREYEHDGNKSEYNRLKNLINRQAKKDKEVWLGQYCEEIENQLNRGYTVKSYSLIRKFFGKPKSKTYYYGIKGGKTLIEDEEITDKQQQYMEELYNDSEELEEVEITPEELDPTITRQNLKKTLKELKLKKKSIRSR